MEHKFEEKLEHNIAKWTRKEFKKQYLDPLSEYAEELGKLQKLFQEEIMPAAERLATGSIACEMVEMCMDHYQRLLGVYIDALGMLYASVPEGETVTFQSGTRLGLITTLGEIGGFVRELRTFLGELES